MLVVNPLSAGPRALCVHDSGDIYCGTILTTWLSSLVTAPEEQPVWYVLRTRPAADPTPGSSKVMVVGYESVTMPVSGG